jgi:hypothetical protein
MAGGGANLAFDNGVNSNKKKGDDAKDKNSGRSNKIVKDSGGMNFRQVMAQEKKKQKKKANKKKKKSGTYQGSKKALAMAWRVLIPSWFTSIFVINAFAFLHLVFPKFFCALGEEWESPMTAVAGGNKGSSTKASMMKSIEPWIVVLINLFVMVIIAIIIMALMIMIALTNPWILGWAVFSELWDLIKSAF